MRRPGVRVGPILIVTISLTITPWAVGEDGLKAFPSLGQDSVPMVIIPAGEFKRGSHETAGRADEQPQRMIYLDAYAIDAFEVTNERYLKFGEATGHRNPPDIYGTGLLTSAKEIEHLPVVQVSWYDAQAYCRWTRKRLPSEAEWEKAARGTEGRRFPWGDDLPTPRHANFDREWDGIRTLEPVGSLPAGDSPYGVKDMAGNAREWVQDWYDPQYYAFSPERNPRGPEKGVVRSIRGGSWHSPISDIGAAARGRGGFALQTHGTGFHCARSINE
jgi:sulfatase modifying factor 1